jgi:hypothetical protein
MDLFNFLKPKKSELNDTLSHLLNSFFPKGEKDINAATDELLHILNNSISRQEARDIAVKAVSLSNITEKFDEDKLKAHLKGYCLHHFNDKQVKQFHLYLTSLIIAKMMYRKTPSEVIRKEDKYIF